MPRRGKPGLPPSRIFGEQVRQTRLRKGWTTQQALADRLSELGHKMDRSAIHRLENGQRGVPLDEAFAIAAALEVSPLSLMLPADPAEAVAVAPALTVTAETARDWAQGASPLPGQDRQFYEQHNPEFWLEAIALRRTRGLYALVAAAGEGLDNDDPEAVDAALEALAGEVRRQRAQIKRQRRRSGGGA